jgi:hypothetical protein
MLSGCTLEQKLAQNYVQSGMKDDFILMKPEYLFKYNLKTYEIEGLDSLEESVKDSLLIDKSLFLKLIDDSTLIARFSEGFTAGLKKYNLNVYPENYLDTFLASGRVANILHLAQFSLEEYVHPYSREEMVDDEIIVIDNIDLNAINYNIWIELSALNYQGSQRVLFGTDFLTDGMEGMLKQYFFTGEMSFDYSIDTIRLEQVYKFAGEFGNKAAGYLFDYFLNRYITENLPRDYQFERYYYHFDPVRNRVYPVDPSESLIELRK